MNFKLENSTIIVITILLITTSSFSQGIGINNTGSNPNVSSILDISSTTKGMLFPRMTTAQRDAINGGSPANSLVIFNTELGCLQIYITGTWQNVYCDINCSAPPSTPGSISGNTTPCQNASGVTYSIAQVAGATSYTWTVPSGATITAGQATTNIIVDFGTTNGNVSVVANNACGSSSAQNLAITLNSIPSQPSVISGNTTVCQNDNAVAYSVTNVAGVTYGWTYSGTGFSCASNCTSNSITADYSATATSGTINVKPTNACGSGTDRTLSITVNAPPTTAAAGTDQNVCATTATLAGNTPSIGSGNWTLISGSGSITSPGSPSSGITGLGVGANTFKWTITNAPCASSFDDVIITRTAPPTTASAGPDQTLACGLTTATLAGNTPTTGTGVWTVVSGTATITTPSSPTSGITGLITSGSVTLRWTISNSPCSPSTDDVVITTTGPCFTGCIPTASTVLNPVTNSTTGETWMDRNLGASQVATASADADAYGCLYQWGRDADEHEDRASTKTTTTSSTDTPGHNDYIHPPSGPPWTGDWRNPQNDNLWQGVAGINNPCPTGYRLPTITELDNERLSWATNNAAGAFGSPLKLPTGGTRILDTGILDGTGVNGLYWASTVNGTFAKSIDFSPSFSGINNTNRSALFSVRCIKD